ncbi:LOW QUALITY PROTEIN: dynein heavy chain 5, axonemal-like [Pecten maximus]|uniref:LOW QUALITY PROTEIN: dynein heavy chain 5, axonemal-like n=1 Tax=Pecten maximus TaxID=6579 RepID=UPI001458903C|nr:LOW QUALITY PROTEIN: dynein heavy chain 5, axonemal-like [Pecten maximus]
MEKPKSPRPSVATRGRAGSTVEMKNKSRLAALAPGENLKEKQLKLKEEREAKRSHIDERHTYILQTVADGLGLEYNEVEDCVLEGNQLTIMDQFLQPNGMSQLLFYYQEPEEKESASVGFQLHHAAPEPKGHVDYRVGPPPTKVARSTKPKVFVTNGRDIPLRGVCLIFTKGGSSGTAITEQNISKEINFTRLDTVSAGKNGSGLLNAVEHLLSSIFIPALKKLNQGWGELSSPSGAQVRTDFLNALDSFVTVLVGAQESLGQKVTLKPCETYDLSKIQTPADYQAVANSSDSLEGIENCMMVWLKQLEQVLAESEQMRKEADDIGPRAELDHWKKRMSRFNYLLDQIKGPNVKAVLGVLHTSQSKLIKNWQELDRRITDLANEAKDNVKFLYTLEKFCDPLYNSDPVGMLEGIPGLINAIRMIHSISRYYNTSERMTSLFVKITNQMITACKAYINCNKTETVWTQEQDDVVKKLRDCIKLNEEYQRSFHKTKEKLEKMPNERPFEFSEMYIFGKFDTFTRRLKKIIEIFDTISLYSHLSESKIEGIEQMANRFTVIVTAMKKKPYDFLDQRKTEFDMDYDEFKRQVAELHANIMGFMDGKFEKISNTARSIVQLRRFERLELPNLGIPEKYQRILGHYGRDIEMVSKLYQKNKNDPPVARDLPPIAGKISWARQLYRRILEPMEVFQKQTNLLESNEAKKIIKNYNKLAKVLLEFEVLYHRGWLRQVETARSGLQASLLVRHPETAELYVNFDPQILTMIRETECMARLGLEIPLLARTMRAKQAEFKENYEALQMMLQENQRVRSKIPTAFEALMGPHTGKVDSTIDPGLNTLTWTSLNIKEYISEVYNDLQALELLMDRAHDVTEFRIDAVLKEMATTNLCQLPEEEPWTVDHFLDNTQMLCAKGAQLLQTKSMVVEEAANELINMLCTIEMEEEESPEEDTAGQEVDMDDDRGSPRGSPTASARDRSASRRSRPVSSKANAVAKKKREMRENIEEAANELLAHFNHRNQDALLKVTRNTLESLRKRITSSSMVHYLGESSSTKGDKKDSRPFYKTFATLAIPNIVMQPALDEVQQAVNKAAQKIILVSKGVAKWSEERKRVTKPQQVRSGSASRRNSVVSNAPSEGSHTAKKGEEEAPAVQSYVIQQQAKNYYKAVSENKEVSKLVSLLSTAINSNKKEVTTALDRFAEYHPIWEVDRDEDLVEFTKEKRSLSEYEAKIKHYEEQEVKIANLPEYYDVGPIALYTENLKLGLTTETKAWRLHYGKACNTKYMTEMEEIFNFMEDVTKRLSRPLKDLDDVRFTMAALKDIRENEIRIDMSISPIEESYAMLIKHDLPVNKEEMERCDTLRYSWEKIQVQQSEVQTQLLAVQPDFKSELIENVKEFKVDCDNYFADYDNNGPMVAGVPPREASDRLLIFQNTFDMMWKKFVTYTGGEGLFGLPVTDSPQLIKIKKELNLLQKLYGLYNNVLETVHGYYDILWTDINIEKINNELIEFQNKCRKLPRALKDWPAFEDLKKTIDDFNEMVPLLELMTNKAMKPRHWQRMSDVTGHVFDVEGDNFMLKNILEAPLLQFKEEIEDICISAVKEKDIEAKLKQVINDWNNQEFTFGQFKTRGELLLRGDTTGEIVSLMEDSLMVLSSLMSNRYNVPFKKQIQLWVQNLTNSSEIIENWMTVQNLWVYLEAVFVGGDIAKQLPKEAKRFSNIDKSWIKIMTRAHETPNVVQCCVGDETLMQLLPHLLEQLELCQKSLTGYLEKKRLLFPRFFFVSDPALLEILGQASDPHTIQAHLLSVFDNIKCVKFHEKFYDIILSIFSSEGETIDLEKHVKAEGNVEVWLMNLMMMAQKSLHGVIRTAAIAIQDNNFQLLEFLDMFPAQVGLLGLQMIWTRDSTDALTHARYDRKIMQQTNQAFLELLNTLIEQTTHDLSKVERTKFETLITIHVHQKDIFDDLVRLHIKSPADFEWMKQSRFYFIEDQDRCLISITDVDFIYQNEFLGCTERLVITPLTDRCYITLAQALGMSMGGAPAGPAGTGKTETTKDMGRCLGKYVVVFNCSDQMDFRGLGRIYKGLAQSGSWGCFDEFNRIELPVLSVAAQQIAIVLTAKKERKKNFIFTDGDNVSLNMEFGIFLTMNPGYAGRQELPENLKINFRTVAMMVPDRQIIIRVKLASVGFIENIVLARKFFTLYKLCEEQLTKQVHYDFGLRNILSCLRTLGTVKRANPTDPESTCVMRVLRDMNLSKLVDQDEPLFLSLIDDLFPGVTLDKGGYPELEGAIDRQIEEAKLVKHPSWRLKLIQLFETQRVRHGMMTLGPSGTGKTCCIHTLMKAMSECGEPHKEMRMNPKAITAPQMFGRLDVATNDWTDGIFSTLWRRTLRTKKGDHIWLVLDGPVDAIWIENLNSVLDDNKTLTLANGDRIQMSPTCKIIFEPHNIDNASPATVSRNGMVFMSSSGLDWSPILQGWLNNRSLAEQGIIMDLFERSFKQLYQYSVQNFEFKMEVLEAFVITQATKIMTGLIPVKDDKDSNQITAAHYERLYIFTLMWSIGAFLELDDRAKLEEYIRNTDEVTLDLPPCRHDSDESMFDFFVNNEGHWEHWEKKLQAYDYPTDSTPEYSSILVPNVDNVRTEYLISIIAKQDKAILLIGEQGTAKTVMINGFMSHYNPEYHLAQSLNFSSATTPYMFQRTIESYVEKRVGSTYGPTAGKKMTVFIDDVNMPTINEWGDQVGNEIVRQLFEMKGFYNLEKPGDFTNIVDVQFMAAMIQPGGGRNDIPQRLKRQFVIINCTLPSNSSIDKIFSVIGCGHYVSERGFKEPVRDMVKKLVPITRRLWQLTKIKMLPTPAKFHYIFNLRDLSRIWQGMINTTEQVVQAPETVLHLWKHECCRVIADRFTGVEDFNWFTKTMGRVVSEELGEAYGTCIDPTHYFVDFLRDAAEATGDEPDDADFEAPKVYEAIENFEQLEERLQMFLAQYNEGIRGSGMDLVFFKDAMTHLVKISRIIRTPRGHALLVGVGGSGKQSLTRLASFIAGYKTFQITLTRSYNVSNLLEDLKYLYRTAGAQGKGMTFIFTDQEIKDEGFLEYLNNVLSSGVVANLFARDEMDEILGELIPIMKKEFPRRPPSNENLYDYYLMRVRMNLHVVLCFSPVGEKFRARSLKFPGLISGCTMDWFQRWPRDALISVADHFLAEFNIECTPEVKKQIIQCMGLIHDGVAESCASYFQKYRRSTHVTPKSYLSFINGYKTIYTDQRNEIGELADRMNTGLEKLIEASQQVAQLSEELAVKEKELAIASEKADKVLATVTVKAQAAEKVKAQVKKVKDKAQAIVDAIEQDKAIAEEKLEKARPALEEAEAALNTIKPADIATVRKLGKPPHLIMRIMDNVLLLFQKRINTVEPDPERPCAKPSWSESLKLMSGTNFLQTLVNFDKDKINDEVIELMQPYLQMEDYNFETAKRVCGNVAGLCSWTFAMAAFFSINKEVLPLKANLAIQEAKLNVAMGDLNTAQAQLDEKEAELAEVMAMYDAAMKEKQKLVDDAETCRRKMNAATELINGLAGERKRWTEQSQEFKAQIGRLVGDVLVCTAFLSYSGPFNQDYRLVLNKNWFKELKTRKIPFTLNLNVIDMLTDPTTVGEWNLQGLPNDELSTQNGIIVTKAARYPLLIDPQGQGKNWIKSRESKNELQITALNHKYFRTHLEDSMSLGRPLLIEDIGEDLDPALDSVLEKNFIKVGSTLKVKVGDKECDIMKGFTLYLTTKLGNPSYTPEVSARSSIIDFTVTMKGLEDQLLGRVILTEKAELESERVKLMEDVQANKKKMKQLEDNLLYRLTSVKGSLVDDEDLINVLNVTKTTSIEVSQKLQTAAETEIKITSAREEFRPVAARGSILYFLIVEMGLVNCMYQTSLKQFLHLFDLSMARSQKSPITQKRITNIIEYMTFEVFKYASRGLYETDKNTFTLLLALKIDLAAGKIKHEEFLTLIKGGASLDMNVVTPKPHKWVVDLTWLNLVELSNLHQFSGILEQVTRNEKQWRHWFDKDAPEEEIIPDGYNNTLDVFRRLLLVRSWCPDRTMAQARKYIADTLGDKYAEGVILDLEKMWMESTSRTPLVCLLSMGSDPTTLIEALAKKHKIECHAISMGQGQEVHARRLLTQGVQNGGWLLLQNCHLSLDYVLEVLDQIIEIESINDEFRVWVTTEVHVKFPINFLQIAIKFTNEPPQGMKAGLKRSYAGMTQDFIDISNMPQWKPMLYGVSFLHSVVQERRKFGPLGWNIPYEFNAADYNASVQFVQNHLDDMDLKKGVNWTNVRYMFGEIQYGGRVTDDYDKRLLNTFCKVWFGEQMFQPNFVFYKGYVIPKCNKHAEYLEFISGLPATDTPEVFGLHGNADITYQSQTAKSVLDTILEIQPKDSSGGGGETRESVVYRLCDDMLDKLPNDYVPYEVRGRLQKMGPFQPMNIFLRQEIDRMQKVIATVRFTLNDLKLAIDGTIIMSENLRDALDSMYDARIPKLWQKISWDSSTLGFWFTELIDRNTQFHTWCFEGRPNTFWMTGFFNAQGFLTAMRQEVTRAHKGWALDSVILHNDVTRYSRDDITTPPSEGVYVYGLFLEGAGWERRGCRLIEPKPKILFETMPVIHIYAINSTGGQDSRMYSCPIYKKPRRTDLTYIAAVNLKTNQIPDHWILRGVALLCDTK